MRKTHAFFQIQNKLHWHYIQAFALSYSFWKAAENFSFWAFFNSSVTASWISTTSAKWSLFILIFNLGNRNSLAKINLESTGSDKGLYNFWGSKTGKHLQFCGWAHYRATRKNLESRTQLDEHAECASGDNPLLLHKIQHLLFFPLVRILCALRLESRKNINIVLMRDLWNFNLFGRGMPHQHIQNSVALFRGHRQNNRSHLP